MIEDMDDSMIDYSFNENPYDDRVKNHLQFIYEMGYLIIIKTNCLQIYDTKNLY